MPGHTHGYVSLACMVMLLVIPFLQIPSVALETSAGLVTLILVVILGAWGLRSPRGGGRIAARLSFTILCLTVAFTFAKVAEEFARQLGEMRP